MSKVRQTKGPPPARPALASASWRGWTHHLGDGRWRAVAVGLIILLALSARLPRLGADAPTDVSWSQDLLTDPPQYTAYARNAISFGDWNPLHDEKLVFFRKNITGAFAYLVFLICGPGVASANLAAVLLNLAAVGFLAWGVGRAFGFLAGAGTAWFLAVNYLFVSYGRQPFLEVASNACLAIAFAAIVVSSQRWWWAIIAGLVGGVGMFFGKVTALHAAPIFLVGTLMSGLPQTTAADSTTTNPSSQRIWTRPLGFVAGLGLIVIVWYVFAYRTASAEVLAYLREQSRSLYGAPVGFSSPSGFLHQWFSFGVDTRLLTLSPILGIVGMLGMCAMAVHYGRAAGSAKKRFSAIPPAAVMIIGWFLSGYLAFSPFNYRPVRYQVVLLLPLAAAAGWLLQHWAQPRHPAVANRPTTSMRPWWWVPVLLVVILATGLQHFLFARLLDPSSRGLTTSSFATAILLGAIIAVGWVMWVSRPAASHVRATGGRRAIEIALALVLLVSLADQGRRFVRWWSNAQYAVTAANRDLSRILGSGAVVTGEWAPALTQEKDSPSGLNQFFVLETSPNFFAERPITHVVTEDKPDASFFRKFPRIAEAAARVTTYTVRNLRIVVLRVAEAGGNAQAGRYVPSFLERLREEPKTHPMDSLLSTLSRRVADSCNTYSGWAYAAELYHKADSVDRAIDAYARALSYDPDDFVLLTLAGDITWERYRTVGGPADREQAVAYWMRALSLSPGNKTVTDRLSMTKRL